ncbi:MAG: ABC transporter ATP-binding protein [Verrucomicrobiae bacterium]|nr:ABC transporter ATP-binding protein [Verrucomicrobiae bacterium]
MTADGLAIHVEHLTVSAGRRRILDVERLAVHPGELLGLLGPNGAGKSTLLRSLLGLQRHAAGAVTVLGERVDTLTTFALARLRQSIGYVPQLLPTHSELPLTVRETVAIGRTGRAGLFRPLRRDDWRVVDEWLERLGLADAARQGYAELSGGQQRKALIARAMSQEPRMLLLDEPTANLDLGSRERMVECIQQLHEQTRVTIVLVCHELEVLPPACRRVVLLKDGCAAAEGSPEEVFTDSRIAALYGEGLAVVHRGGRHAVTPAGGPE